MPWEGYDGPLWTFGFYEGLELELSLQQSTKACLLSKGAEASSSNSPLQTWLQAQGALWPLFWSSVLTSYFSHSPLTGPGTLLCFCFCFVCISSDKSLSSLNLSSPGYDPVNLGHVLKRLGCWLTIQPAVLITCSGHLLGGVPFRSGSSRTDDLPESWPEMPRATWKLRLDSSQGLCSHSRLSAIPSLERRSHSFLRAFLKCSPTLHLLKLYTPFLLSTFISLSVASRSQRTLLWNFVVRFPFLTYYRKFDTILWVHHRQYLLWF